MSKSVNLDLLELDQLAQSMQSKVFDKALVLAGDLCAKNPLSPYLWIVRARLEMLVGGSDEDPFGAAESFLLAAYKINQNDMEVLEELAHFYDVIVPDREKAKQFGVLLLEKLKLLERDMDDIVYESE